MGCLFYRGAYKHDLVVVIKICGCIHGCLFSMGAYYPDFTISRYVTVNCIVVLTAQKVERSSSMKLHGMKAFSVKNLVLTWKINILSQKRVISLNILPQYYRSFSNNSYTLVIRTPPFSGR